MSKINFDLLSKYLIKRDIESVKKLITHNNILDTETDGDGILANILWSFDDDSNGVVLIRYFLDLGASIQTFNKHNDWSLLHIAVRKGKPKSTRELINLGIPVDILDKDKQTPLAFCLNCYKVDHSIDVNANSIRVLLDAGAQLSLVHSTVVIPQWARNFVDYRNTLRNASVIILGLKRCNSNILKTSKNGLDVLRIIARCVWESRGGFACLI